MIFIRALLIAALGAGIFSAPALAERPRDRNPPMQQAPGPHREQERAFEGRREGRSMPLPQLEQRVMPLMGGADYLGPEFNGQSYRMKFIQNGRVIWVDVDPQTGRIIRRSRDH
jgi:hypothetical protein